jgi:hypothetical protein
MTSQDHVFRAAVTVAALFTASIALAQPAASPLSAYSYADCSAANTPQVRIVLYTGAVPAALPASAPTPAVHLILNGTADKIVTTPITISTDAIKGGPNAAALSCPVVGDCAPATSGTVTVQRGADGTLTGQYTAQWGTTPPRSNRFAAGWKESTKKCG